MTFDPFARMNSNKILCTSKQTKILVVPKTSFRIVVSQNEQMDNRPIVGKIVPNQVPTREGWGCHHNQCKEFNIKSI